MQTIQDVNGKEVDAFDALYQIVHALDKRFPDGNGVFQRVSRLCEESGELASAVNRQEKMGLKQQKHDDDARANLVKELQDVLRATLGIAVHYGAEEELRQSIEHFYQEYQKAGGIPY